MHLGMIGLGKMGLNMVSRLLRGGHQVTVYDLSVSAMQAAEKRGARTAERIETVPRDLPSPRVVWVMVPAGEPTEQAIQLLAKTLQAGDVIVDGGNSNYRDTQRRAAELAERELHLVDIGTSGGIWGLSDGYSLMVGGDEDIVAQLQPLLQTLAPDPEHGWGHVGPSGAGHFVKMVHNGVEYGLMQSYAEGFDLLRRKQAFNLDLHQVAEIWRHGSVVRSWLLDLTSEALAENPALDGIAPYVSDSGEGRWAVQEAVELECPLPAISISLQQRFRSRTENSFADRLLAAMRQSFGGHEVKKPR